MDDCKYLLPERELPKSWYNVIPDLPQPLPPPLHPGTGKPASPSDFEAIFPQALIDQEMTSAVTVPIPDPVRDMLRLWRPTPLHRQRFSSRTMWKRRSGSVTWKWRAILCGRQSAGANIKPRLAPSGVI